MSKISGPLALSSYKISNKCILVAASPGAEAATIARGGEVKSAVRSPPPAPSVVTKAAPPGPSVVKGPPGPPSKSKPPPPSRPAISGGSIDDLIESTKAELKIASDNLQFEEAAILRDKLKELQSQKSSSGSSNVSFESIKVTNGLAAIGKKMDEANKKLDFEKCAKYRDAIKVLKETEGLFNGAASEEEKQGVLDNMDYHLSTALAL